MKKYLLFVSHSYAYPILRPIQNEILQRGGSVAWYIEDTSPILLKGEEVHLKTIKEVIDYNPIAIFAPGNRIYDFFPGIKVQVFHGFDIRKRPGRGEHYEMKGWFDLYCTQGLRDTAEFERLSTKLGYFKTIQTGWAKVDGFYNKQGEIQKSHNQRPVILYASTFTRRITSTPYVYEEIERLIKEKDWEWLITLHPKMDQETVKRYKGLAEYPNVSFYEGDNNIELLEKADVMVCDSSSIIVEFLFFEKPVVTYKNTYPGNHLIDIDNPLALESSIEYALSRPDNLISNIKEYTEAIHPYKDGKSSGRILDAVDYFIENYKGKIKRKPLNIFRKLKIRKKVGYFPFGPYYRHNKK